MSSCMTWDTSAVGDHHLGGEPGRGFEWHYNGVWWTLFRYATATSFALRSS